MNTRTKSEIVIIMPPVSKRIISPKTAKNIYDLLVHSFSKAKGKTDLLSFFSDLLTPTEQIMISKRLAIAFLLLRKDYDMRGIASTLKVSTSTVARVNMILNTKGEGFRKILSKIQKDEDINILLFDLFKGFSPFKGRDLEKWKSYKNLQKRNIKSF